MKSAFEINVEYGALRTFCALVNAVPYGAAMAVARGAAWFLVRVCGLKRKRTMERLSGVFPDKPRSELRAIAVKSLQNVFAVGVEMMRAPSLDRAWMDKHVVNGAKYEQVLKGLAAEGKGVVIMVPHTGNWYMAAWAMAKYGLPLFAIAARQRNPKLNAWMNRQYGDIEVLDRDNRETLVQIKEKLQAGRCFAILPDLRVRKRDVEVDFLGGKANVSHAGAMFAVRAGAPIVVGAMSREGGKHVLSHLATLRPNPENTDAKAEARRLTQAVMKSLSDFVLAHPSDWFWYNKRWILEPPED